MRQHFTAQELADHFTLMPEDAELLAQKTEANRLGCALLLKCLQWEGRFLTTWTAVPREVIRHLAQAVGIPFGRYQEYPSTAAWRAITRTKSASGQAFDPTPPLMRMTSPHGRAPTHAWKRQPRPIS